MTKNSTIRLIILILILLATIMTSCSGSGDGSSSNNGNNNPPPPGQDIEAPTQPTQLQSNSTSLTEIDLSWHAATDNVGVSGYNIYRNDVFINSTTDTQYTDSDLTASTLYTYTVSAYDEAGNESDKSESAECLTLSADYDTYYVAEGGNNENGDGSFDLPWATIDFALGEIEGGDTLIIMDGQYTVFGEINRISDPPSGNAINDTVIKAQNDGGVTLTGDNLPIEFASKHHIRIEGLTIKDISRADRGSIWLQDCEHVKLSKIGIVNGGAGTYANIIIVGGTSQYILLEDIWITGGMRYGISISDPARYIILRRCVVRPDYSTSNQPKSGICIYGGKDTTNPDTDHIPTRDVLVQNSIVLDLNPEQWGGGYLYGGFNGEGYQHDNRYQGCIALNINATTTGIHGIIGFKQYTLSGAPHSQGGRFEHSVAWDISGAGYYWGESLNTGQSFVDHVTAGLCNSYGVYSRGSENRSLVHITNSLFYDNGQKNSIGGNNYTGWEEQDSNFFDPASIAEGTNPSTGSADFEHIIVSPQEGYGATIVKRFGADGSFWGEDGFNTLSDVDLWPFPHEDRIKSLFSDTNTPPPGAYPTTNDTTRGFCSDGLQLNGKDEITLTSYIWEYIGYQMPTDIYP